MSSETVNQIVERLAQAGPLDPGRFSALLGAPLAPAGENPYWKFYTFELGAGPFARGELRLNTAGSAALLSLEPRDPPGLAETDVDPTAWGQRRGLLPNPRIPPEGADSEIFQMGAVQISAQWLHTSRKLRTLVLEWPAPQPGASPAGANA